MNRRKMIKKIRVAMHADNWGSMAQCSFYGAVNIETGK